jgi:hypothetical protein
MNNLYQKLKAWYRGKYVSHSMQDMIDNQSRRFGEPQNQLLPERYEPPLIAKIINRFLGFLREEWKFVIGAVFTVTTLFFTYLKLGK